MTVPQQACEYPTFTHTGHGIHARLPLVPIVTVNESIVQPSLKTAEYCLAPLACRFSPDSATAPGRCSVCLVLRRPDKASTTYEIGAEFRAAGFARYVTIDFADPESKSILGVGPHNKPTYRWKDVYISQPITHPSERLIPTAPTYTEGHGAQFIIVPHWILRSLHDEGFEIVHPDNPHAPKHVSTNEGQMYVFHNRKLKEEVRVHAGWCAGEKGLWITVEFVDITTNGAVCVEPVHDLVPPNAKRSSKVVQDPISRPCNHNHVRDWSVSPSDASGNAITLDELKLRWARYRTFEKLGRAVHLRVVGTGSDDEKADSAPPHDQQWVLGIELGLPWSQKQSIPPPANAKPTYPVHKHRIAIPRLKKPKPFRARIPCTESRIELSPLVPNFNETQ